MRDLLGLSVFIACVIAVIATLLLSVACLLLCIFRPAKKFRMGATIAWSVTGGIMMITGLFVAVYGLKDIDFKHVSGVYNYKTVNLSHDCDEILLDLSAANVKVEIGDTLSYTIAEEIDYQVSYNVNEGKNYLSLQQERDPWFFRLGWKKAFLPDVTITLPKNHAIDFSVKFDAGYLTVSDGTFTSFRADLDAGDILLMDSEAELYDISVDAGNTEVLTCRGDLMKIRADAGNILLQDSRFAVTDVRVDCGDITCQALSSDEISLAVDLGAINGTLRGVASEYTVTTLVTVGANLTQSHEGTTEKTLLATCEVGSIDLLFEN